MNSSELLMEGVELMALGMGSVFIFLIVLVMVTTLMSKMLGKYFPEAAPVPRPVAKTAAPGAAVDAETLAVIGAAIKQHRARRRP